MQMNYLLIPKNMYIPSWLFYVIKENLNIVDHNKVIKYKHVYMYILYININKK